MIETVYYIDDELQLTSCYAGSMKSRIYSHIIGKTPQEAYENYLLATSLIVDDLQDDINELQMLIAKHKLGIKKVRNIISGQV